MEEFKLRIQIWGIFIVDCVKMYFSPVVAVVKFFGVFVEMFRNFFISLVITSEDFKKLQDSKLEEETQELIKKGSTVEEIESDFDK